MVSGYCLKGYAPLLVIPKPRDVPYLFKMVFLELPSPEGRQWNCSRCLALSPFRKGMALCFTHAIRFLLALTWKCLLTFACFYAHLEDSVDFVHFNELAWERLFSRAYVSLSCSDSGWVRLAPASETEMSAKELELAASVPIPANYVLSRASQVCNSL